MPSTNISKSLHHNVTIRPQNSRAIILNASTFRRTKLRQRQRERCRETCSHPPSERLPGAWARTRTSLSPSPGLRTWVPPERNVTLASTDTYCRDNKTGLKCQPTTSRGSQAQKEGPIPTMEEKLVTNTGLLRNEVSTSTVATTSGDAWYNTM